MNATEQRIEWPKGMVSGGFDRAAELIIGKCFQRGRIRLRHRPHNRNLSALKRQIREYGFIREPLPGNIAMRKFTLKIGNDAVALIVFCYRRNPGPFANLRTAAIGTNEQIGAQRTLVGISNSR